MKTYRVTVDGRTYSVEIDEPTERPMRVRVDGELLLVDIAEGDTRAGRELSRAQPARDGSPTGLATSAVVDAGPAPARSSRPIPHTLIAPIPGVVTSIVARPGQLVQRGDELLTIEAMKMFNVIRSPQAGTIAEVLVAEGGRVAQGVPLVTFAPV